MHVYRVCKLDFYCSFTICTLGGNPSVEARLDNRPRLEMEILAWSRA